MCRYRIFGRTLPVAVIPLGMHTVDGLHVLAFVILGLTLAHGVLAIAEHYFPGSEGVLAGRFIVGGAS